VKYHLICIAIARLCSILPSLMAFGETILSKFILNWNHALDSFQHITFGFARFYHEECLVFLQSCYIRHV